LIALASSNCCVWEAGPKDLAGAGTLKGNSRSAGRRAARQIAHSALVKKT
jgi:hypothetical protein